MKPNAAIFEEAYLQLLKVVTTANVIKFYCTDLSSIGALDREQESWLNLEYYPKAYDLIQDDIYVAVVFSEEHFKAIVTNYQVTIPDTHHHFIQFTYFTNVEEALHWLQNIKGQDAVSV
ncbi:hypothetical protein [Pontibacter liquoris]|uniref:hypothetical protein n=1 Tax=Pontibacter liquoris TaxID=2905677 RepID=UPI001FA76A8D|nr:hypothetical protein [Pontibacter liquoris]